MRVGGELGNIEMQLHKPLDYRGDNNKRMPYKHRLSLANAKHGLSTVAIKTVAVLASTYMGAEHPSVVATVRSRCNCQCYRCYTVAGAGIALYGCSYPRIHTFSLL